jgi:hypothetical protein
MSADIDITSEAQAVKRLLPEARTKAEMGQLQTIVFWAAEAGGTIPDLGYL